MSIGFKIILTLNVFTKFKIVWSNSFLPPSENLSNAVAYTNDKVNVRYGYETVVITSTLITFRF